MVWKHPLRAQIALAVLGFILGGLVFGLVAVWARYGIAGTFSANREKQAYVTLLIVPGGVLVGVVTGALCLSAIPTGAWKRLLFTIPAWPLLLWASFLGHRFHRVLKPGVVELRNESSHALEHVYLGRDFRRSVRVGHVPVKGKPCVAIDLGRSGSFGRISGRWQGKHFTLRESDADKAIEGSRVYVVRQRGEKLELQVLGK